MRESPERTQLLISALSGRCGENERLYAVLDAAQNPEIPARLEFADAEHCSLYAAERERDLRFVAPYLVLCRPGSAFFDWVLVHGWGRCWGIFLTSGADTATLRSHFRRFLLVEIEGEEQGRFYFRFYDPRVLRRFLPMCSPTEAGDFFGPISALIAEGEADTTLLAFTSTALGVNVSRVGLARG